MDFVNIFNGTSHENSVQIDNHFEFELDEFQKEANYRISIKENILLCAHTGSGKTVPAIFAIHEALKYNKKVIYTSPIKTLSNQKYDELKNIFDDVGIMTGDIKMNPDAQIIVMTTEILRNILYKNGNESIQPEHIGYVVFDEVHYFNDPHRGKVWEECIILLDKEVVLVMLSATIDKPELFAAWVGGLKHKNISVISTHHRVVPLTHYIFDQNDEKLDVILDKKRIYQNYDMIKKKYKKIDNLGKFIPYFSDYLMNFNYTPSLFFLFSRQECIKLAKCVQKSLLNDEETKELTILFKKLTNPIKTQYSHLDQYNEIEKLLYKGVCYHHSGLIPILKEVVEIIYGSGLIKILFATETFAVGVNKPVKTVIFKQLDKFDNNGKRFLRSDEYTQMAGRAGRRGIDKVGHVILLPVFDLPQNKTLENIIRGKSPSIQSKFGITYQFIIKNLLNENDVISTLKNTYLNIDIVNQIQSKDIYIEDLNTKINSFNKSMNEELKEYFRIDNLLKENETSFIKMNAKQLKSYKKQLKQIEKKIDNFEETYKDFIGFNDLQNELEKQIRERRECENYFHYYYQNIYNLLVESQFIENDKVTLKGEIAIFTNECHELILSELVFEGFFENKTCNEILLYLSLFIQEENDSNCYLSDYDLIDKEIKKNVMYIDSKFDKYLKLQDKYNFYENDYQQKINIAFLMPVYIWIHNLPLQDIYNYTQMFEGNFVKGILKLNNMIEDLKNMLEKCNYMDVIKKLELSETLLIKDFVNVNSLYIT